MTTLQKFFGKKASPEEMVRKWQRDIRNEMRSLDRTITKTEIAEKQAIKDLRQAAQKNDVKSCKIFAKGLVGIRKQKQKLHTGKAQLNSINLQLQHQLGLLGEINEVNVPHETVVKEEEEPELDEMQARLLALKS
ncbi:11903_t:CDS:2 [Acaulospora morrowiae]|uniref:11903_t:CDS:1 n=1 Tax=Acaulospora morrowiae TaxID=94023 RepID=A0A9N9ASQ7_9GLOM|nr:11903_t:CDS:2 [Acaulospora morrowiae]